MKKIISLICVFLFYGCIFTYDPPQKFIDVYNNSDSTIYVAYSYTDSLSKYPMLCLFDTLKVNATDAQGNSITGKIYSPNYRINPYSFGTIEAPAEKSSFKNIPDGKLRVFFISEHTMKTRTWNDIYSNQLYQKKVKYTYKELQECHFSITYKP